MPIRSVRFWSPAAPSCLAMLAPTSGRPATQSGGGTRLRLKVEHGRSAGGMAYSRTQHFDGEVIFVVVPGEPRREKQDQQRRADHPDDCDDEQHPAKRS